MDLPHDLLLALSTELAAATPGELTGHVSALSARYRDGGTEWAGPPVRSDADAAAYAAYRLPATFAAVYAALTALKTSVPGVRPSSLLDVGAGPGTATWAAALAWPELRRATLLEREERMIALGERLARHASARAVRDATWRRADIVGDDWGVESADLVVAAYALGEVPQAGRDAFVARLWAHAATAVLIVEPGTPGGFAAVRRARALLTAGGASIAAPCPHDAACPMPDGDWCHFAQRITRTPLHRGAKGATLSYEDEKFSYIGAVRGAAPARAARVLRHPRTRKGLVSLELCTPSGLQRRAITRKDGSTYRQARDASWGSTFAPAAGHEADT